ncbi:cytochrome P450 [Streptacidiphilus sp. PB12-B1b]|uniref:cytochrome P450 n=1 Tax=Streptacidiphilus sp. PB12-B1b TaxID=2705012 RepID=UPI001CDCEDE8|nr:cytochrome P450 [Streptacidiphilus sp. PB12-B1b]
MPPYLAEPVPLFGPAFAADPHTTYARLRGYGPLAPVLLAEGVPAWLVTDYQAALALLRDPVTWSKDPRAWEATVPADCPVLPMIGYRPNVLFSDGEEHARYRSVITDSLAMVDLGQLRAEVLRVADLLIAQFSGVGEADLITQFTGPLPTMVFTRLFGLGEEYSPHMVAALAGMLEATGPEQATAAGAAFFACISDLVAAKSRLRGPDLASWYLDHPAGLSTEQVIQQVVLTLGAALEPTANLISNAVSVLLSDRAYYSSLANGSLAARSAIDEVLRREPPMANYGAHYVRQDTVFCGTYIRPDEPVLVSYAAVNAGIGGGPAGSSGGGAHLAWSAGPHACPAKQPAFLIATTAVERLTNALGDLQLAVPRAELPWRPGPFQRALAHLPVRFAPVIPN